MIRWEDHVGDDVFQTTETVARGSWYGVSGIPHVRIDGLSSVIGAGSCASAANQYRSLINNRLNSTGGLSPVEIVGTYLAGGSDVTIQATFRLVDPATLTSLRATLVLVEDDITWCCGYGGVSHWDNVNRKLYDQNITLTKELEAAIVQARRAGVAVSVSP